MVLSYKCYVSDDLILLLGKEKKIFYTLNSISMMESESVSAYWIVMLIKIIRF